jgi:hypothetical protein
VIPLNGMMMMKGISDIPRKKRSSPDTNLKEVKMDKKEREQILRQINGALLDLLSVQERMEAKQINNSMEVDKTFRLLASLDRRTDLIRRQIENQLETLGGKK